MRATRISVSCGWWRISRGAFTGVTYTTTTTTTSSAFSTCTHTFPGSDRRGGHSSGLSRSDSSGDSVSTRATAGTATCVIKGRSRRVQSKTTTNSEVRRGGFNNVGGGSATAEGTTTENQPQWEEIVLRVQQGRTMLTRKRLSIPAWNINRVVSRHVRACVPRAKPRCVASRVGLCAAC